MKYNLKFLFIVYVHLLSNNLFSQNIFMPFRIGNKFGISDEKGKMLLPAKYDKIEYLQDSFFISYNYQDSIDKNGKKHNYLKTGLIKRDVEIISENKRFSISIEKTLVGFHNEDGYKLYNVSGKKVLNETISKISINPTNIIGNLGTASSNLILVALFKKEFYNTQMSVAVYDVKKQKITDWLLRNVTSYELDEKYDNKLNITFNYTDSTGKQKKQIAFSNGKFIITDYNDKKIIVSKAELSKEKESEKTEPIFGTINQSRKKNNDDNYVDETIDTTLSSNQTYIYTIKNDSLFYSNALYSPKSYIPIDDKETVMIFYGMKAGVNIGNYQQTIPIIYKKQSKFGFLSNARFLEPEYDSVVYLNYNYLVGKYIDGKMLYGILNNKLKTIIPIEYDSIFVDIRSYGSQIKFNYPQFHEPISLHIQKSRSSASNTYTIGHGFATRVQLFKNKLTGIIDLNGNIIVPIIYDELGNNNVQNYNPKIYTSYYIVTKRDNHYQIMCEANSGKKNKLDENKILKQDFKYFPIYYIRNYFLKPNYYLIGLCNINGDFLGYCDSNGKYFMKD